MTGPHPHHRTHRVSSCIELIANGPRAPTPLGREFVEDRLNADQVDYLEAVSSFIATYDQERVKWPKGTALDTLKYLLAQHEMSAADLSRILRSDRSLGPKLLRGERRLTVGHIRTLARRFNVEPGVLF